MKNIYQFNVKDLSSFCVSFNTAELDCSDIESYEIAIDQTEEEMENEEWQPMMNYCYPLENEFEVPKNIKEILDEAGSITLIRKTSNDRYYLALSGGGMDLSWDICRAYTLLGYLPPLSYCSLPEFADMNMKTPRNKKVIEACLQSAEITKRDGAHIVEKLKGLKSDS